MKIALVALKEGLIRIPPLGLSYLATYINRKIGYKDTVIVDGNFEDIHKKLRSMQPDLIGISSITQRYGDTIKLAKEIRGYSNAVIILGGVHISTMPHSLNDAFDFAVYGEGEETFKELVSAMLEKGRLDISDLAGMAGIVYKDEKGEIRVTPPRPLIKNLDDIPYPDFNYLNPGYLRPVDDLGLKVIAPALQMMTSRGCPYRCVFCSTSVFWDHYRNNSPEYIADNIRYLVEQAGPGIIINILDDMFTVNKNRLRKLHGLLEQEGLLGKFYLTGNARSNHIDDEMCEILESLNMKKLSFGFESGSDNVLKYLKVGSTSVEKNKAAIKTCVRHNIAVVGSLMFGSPGETADDLKLTLDFIDYAYKENVSYIWAFVATPFPRTQFWEIAKQKGKVSDNMDWDKSGALSFYDGKKPLLSDVEPEEFFKIFKEAYGKLQVMRYRLMLKFFLANPFKAIVHYSKNIPFYAKRFYYYVFRF